MISTEKWARRKLRAHIKWLYRLSLATILLIILVTIFFVGSDIGLISVSYYSVIQGYLLFFSLISGIILISTIFSFLILYLYLARCARFVDEHIKNAGRD